MSFGTVSLHESRIPVIGRRAFLTGAVGVGALGLAACAGGGASGSSTNPLGAAALPTEIPPGTKLAIAIHRTQKTLEASGLITKLPFQVPQWPNLSAGPDVIQGFRANSVDLASNAGIPPIQAHTIRFDAKIVAVQVKNQPTYTFATAPGSDVRKLADLRGKKIAFSQGQAQGVVVLRTLKELGLKTGDVQLVRLNSTQFLTALQARQVDAAPLGEPTLTKYLQQYQRDGARAVDMHAVDLLTILWAPTSVLQVPAKAAAIRGFIPLWAQGEVWAWENRDAWIDYYYVKDQGVSREDGVRIHNSYPKPVFPARWDRAIAWEQETIDLLDGDGFDPKFKAEEVFDRRFEGIAADAVPSAYRE